MLLILPILFLLLAVVVMLVASRLRAHFGYYWFIAVGGAFLAWISVWLLHSRLPLQAIILPWLDTGVFDSAPSLLADAFSWPFVLAIITLIFVVLLTDVQAATEINWTTWAGSLALAALGTLAVMAGNPLTLILAWTIVDVMELLLLIPRAISYERRRQVIIFFTTSVMGTMLLFAADLTARQDGTSLSFEYIPPGVGLYLFIAVGLRLGVLPLHLPFVREPDLRRGFGTVMRLVSPAASLILLVRTATTAVVFRQQFILYLLVALAAYYGAVSWARARDELVARPYWILAITSMVFVSVLRGQPGAALTWSLLMIYAGGALFLFSSRSRRLQIVLAFAAIGLLSLPGTPGWQGAQIYAQPFNTILIIFLPVQALLVLGYIRHLTASVGSPPGQAERWVTLIYPAGLILIVLVNWVSAFLIAGGVFALFQALVWPGLTVVALAVAIGLLARRGIREPELLFSTLDAVFSLRWLYGLFGWVFTLVQRLINLMTQVLEGEGGVLWALLLVSLLLSLLQQLGVGG